MDVGLHFNFGLGWEGRGLVFGSLLFAGWDICFIFSFWLGVVFSGILRGQILFKFFFTFFLIFFTSFLFFGLLCGGTFLIFVQHSLFHSHNFFVYWGEV